MQASLKALKDDAIKSFKPRTPKKITDITTKLQMKRMVEDLESEIGNFITISFGFIQYITIYLISNFTCHKIIGELYVILKNAGVTQGGKNEKEQLEKDIEDIRSKLSKTESEKSNEKSKLQIEINKLKEINSKLESDVTINATKCKKLEDDKNSAIKEKKMLQEEIKKLESQISKLNDDLST